ncbi:hypothetical protein [Clostridium sp. AM58-1XD]|uniref:hypothetical protein n=1 Tax=Clostridium sp. AM58-1XD TaxID=2292307 RepID=UPI001FA83176|nr:hypothetical protein [Clostridium sp. AM58-1XD]
MKQKTNRILIQILFLFVTFVVSMGIFLASYRFDNKYRLHTPQPIGGILFFDQI